MILASKSGWLIAGKVIKETSKSWHFKPVDSEHTQIISKYSDFTALFNDVKEAMKWIEDEVQE